MPYQQDYLRAVMKLTRLKDVELDLFSLLEKLYPHGTTIFFNIRTGQRVPSEGTVMSYPCGMHGTVRVRMKSKAQKVVDVPLRQIMGIVTQPK